jgi:hypothetical protein
LGNSHHVESELLKDAMVSEGIGLRQHCLLIGWWTNPRCYSFNTGTPASRGEAWRRRAYPNRQRRRRNL